MIKNLKRLDLSYNFISEKNGLEGLTSLEVLNKPLKTKIIK